MRFLELHGDLPALSILHLPLDNLDLERDNEKAVTVSLQPNSPGFQSISRRVGLRLIPSTPLTIIA